MEKLFHLQKIIEIDFIWLICSTKLDFRCFQAGKINWLNININYRAFSLSSVVLCVLILFENNIFPPSERKGHFMRYLENLLQKYLIYMACNLLLAVGSAEG